MTWAIEARGLGKQYVRGAAHHRVDTRIDRRAEWWEKMLAHVALG